jgi:16S rRNA (uracil1498-N3)-methyltransferase
MATPRVFLSHSPQDAKTPFDWPLDSRESHHLSKVLRLRDGDALCAFDGQGRTWQGYIKNAGRREITINLTSMSTTPALQPERILLQALPKQKAWETILRMAAEIGVTRIVPVFSTNSEIRLDGERIESKMEKWRQSLIEACKQCGLPYLPVIETPLALTDWIATQNLPMHGCIASLEANTPYLMQVPLPKSEACGAIHAAIGPEGDFTAEEYSLLRDAGLTPVRLGKHTLRCDTAAAYTLSVLDQLFS